MRGRSLWRAVSTSLVLVVTVLLLLAVSTMVSSNEAHDSKRVYREGEQFPKGSGHLLFPPTAQFSIFMGEVKYQHLPLLFESMRWNPTVQFILINIIQDGSNQADKLLKLKNSMDIPNIHVEVIPISKFKTLVNTKLGLNTTMDATWYYKMCDFKPVLAFLFPDLVPETKYKYWGYADMDVIWGNFSRYAHWFQSNPRQPFVISGWFGTTGAGAWYINTETTRKLFMEDPKYVPLLNNIEYHNLDEGGTQTKPENVIDGGSHCISEIQKRHMNNLPGGIWNRAQVWQDHCFIDQADSNDWAGPVRWFRGSLQIIHGSPEFPPGRELLFYHRPHKELDFPASLAEDIFKDMVTYGYLLPNWVPLSTRYMCRQAGVGWGTPMAEMHKYRPYDPSCFGKGGRHKHSLD